jgi:hypothetical protein
VRRPRPANAFIGAKEGRRVAIIPAKTKTTFVINVAFDDENLNIFLDNARGQFHPCVDLSADIPQS